MKKIRYMLSLVIVIVFGICACNKKDSGEQFEYENQEKYQEVNEMNVPEESSEELTPALDKNKIQDLIKDISNSSIGDIISFGNYEQDNDFTNGAEEIQWKVIDKKDGKAFLLSTTLLSAMKYSSNQTYADWQSCSLRSWLNEEFYYEAFNQEEQLMIATTTVKTSNNPEYDTDGGNNTEDKVFTLSLDEMIRYFGLNPDDINPSCDAKISDYAVAQGGYVLDKREAYTLLKGPYIGNGFWWLRTPGKDQSNVIVICPDGAMFMEGGPINDETVGVRPAMWVNYVLE